MVIVVKKQSLVLHLHEKDSVKMNCFCKMAAPQKSYFQLSTLSEDAVNENPEQWYVGFESKSWHMN